MRPRTEVRPPTPAAGEGDGVPEDAFVPLETALLEAQQWSPVAAQSAGLTAALRAADRCADHNGLKTPVVDRPTVDPVEAV